MPPLLPPNLFSPMPTGNSPDNAQAATGKPVLGSWVTAAETPFTSPAEAVIVWVGELVLVRLTLIGPVEALEVEFDVWFWLWFC